MSSHCSQGPEVTFFLQHHRQPLPSCCRRCLVAKLCLTLYDPMDCSTPGSSVHGISQTRILDHVVISSARGSSWPRDWIHISCVGRWILYHWVSREACLPLCQGLLIPRTGDILGLRSCLIPRDFPQLYLTKTAPSFSQVLLSFLLIDRSRGVKLFKCPEHLIYDQHELTKIFWKYVTPSLTSFQETLTMYLAMCSLSRGCVTFNHPVSLSIIKTPTGGVSAPWPVML